MSFVMDSQGPRHVHECEDCKPVKPVQSYRVSALGVTLLCTKGQSMLDWIAYIIERGGVPSIERVTP